MTKNELFDKACEFARTRMAAKAKSKITQFALGAACSGVGRRMMEDKVGPMLAIFTKADGCLDMESLKEAVCGGMSAAGSIPMLGNLISVDIEDTKEFFEFIGCPVATATAAASAVV